MRRQGEAQARQALRPSPHRRRALGVAAALGAAALLAFASSAAAAGPPGDLDARAWELVSPVDKNGGAVGAPGTPAAGVLQAAVQGGALAFGSAFSFGAAAGSLPVNQYLASRGLSGWSTENVTPSAVPSGSYPAGAYELFSEDLGQAVLNGGSEAFHLAFEGASPDLAHRVFSAADVLYETGAGADQTISTAPGAALADGPGAVSADGSRVYWTLAGDLYLYEDGASRLVATAAFQAASRDGSLAFYTRAGHLYRYRASDEALADLTPGGGAVALVGLSDDGSVLYYVAADGLYRYAAGAATQLLASGPGILPPAGGRALASADGSRLFFDSPAALVGKDTNAAPDVYEWEAGGTGSCSPVGGCLALVSSGFGAASALAGAGASGEDVFFATAAALLPADPDAALDLYDARAGGGFPEPETPVCLGDDCQGPAPAPDYESPPTRSLLGRPNPPPRFAKRRHKHKHRRHHAKKHKHRSHRHGGRR